MNGLVGDGEEGLELGGLRFLVHYRCADAGEAGFCQHRFELCLAEAEPLVGVEFAGFFKTVPGEVEDDDAAAGDENRAASLKARSGCRA